MIVNTGWTALLWTVIGFLLGSIPFALLIGKLFFKIDIRNYGDGNPGATNLWKARSFGWGVVAYLFDFFKGAVPVGLCFFLFNIRDWYIVPVALAPVLGHAFSPFLRFHGGKAIACLYGTWAGLTIWEVPVFLAVATYFFSIFQKVHSWIQVITMLAFLGFLVLRYQDQPFFYPFLAIWTGNFAIIIIKHAAELRCRPQPQPWILKLLKRSP